MNRVVQSTVNSFIQAHFCFLALPAIENRVSPVWLVCVSPDSVCRVFPLCTRVSAKTRPVGGQEISAHLSV